MNAVGIPRVRRPAPPSLTDHHACCELNYHLCMTLFPGCREGRTDWIFSLDTPQAMVVHAHLEESAPYTTTLVIQPSYLAPFYLQAPRLRVRLYHDADMAEVIAWNRHHRWLPVYDYPNPQMYMRDEKQALNRFLSALLGHCRKLGIASGSVCEWIRINRK